MTNTEALLEQAAALLGSVTAASTLDDAHLVGRIELVESVGRLVDSLRMSAAAELAERSRIRARHRRALLAARAASPRPPPRTARTYFERGGVAAHACRCAGSLAHVAGRRSSPAAIPGGFRGVGVGRDRVRVRSSGHPVPGTGLSALPGGPARSRRSTAGCCSEAGVDRSRRRPRETSPRRPRPRWRGAARGRASRSGLDPARSGTQRYDAHRGSRRSGWCRPSASALRSGPPTPQIRRDAHRRP